MFLECTETTSTVISFALYELALNPKHQEILYDEIVEMLSIYDDQFSNEAPEDLIYLEATLHETIRLHTPAMTMGKICTKRFTLPRNAHQMKPFMIRPGMAVNIPIHAIHM